jgi:hypothetical protein
MISAYAIKRIAPRMRFASANGNRDLESYEGSGWSMQEQACESVRAQDRGASRMKLLSIDEMR